MPRLLKIILLSSVLAAAGGATPPERIANAPLVDQNGKPFQVHDLNGNFVFVAFVFTRCPMPDMCPLTMTKTAQVLRRWKEAGIKAPLRALVVTLDPEHDSPAVLKQYARSHRLDLSRATLATGTPQAITAFTESFNVMAMPAGGTIAHNQKNILVAPDLTEIAQYKDNEFEPAQVIKDARAHLKLAPKN